MKFVRHWTGKLIPESAKPAKDHTRAELFELYVPHPLDETIERDPARRGSFVPEVKS